ncbi:hypothetical protein PtA15_17A330 [Puccinia triticina]|uniref:Uncharacterized protein n=1 Tax=Puccinia triticina TaxID=208348 RepID=A0ABY7D8D9_9BASI|nr:uncharacterized protein PtA15_17A330 [Puccinia triticina]WAQ92848.1 hypothetical protein PtA15_17A330 [Puccinia triticina]
MNPPASSAQVNRPSSSSNSNESNSPSISPALLTRRRFLPLDPPTPTSTATRNRTSSRNDTHRTEYQDSTNALDTRRRESEPQRNLMDIHRDTLRAAERTISLLREQIRLHDERARLSIASLVPPPAPVGTPARTPTQRAALERSLSSRIAILQADIERQQLRANAVGLIRRPETEALLEERNMLIAHHASPRIPPRAVSNACPTIPSTTSIATPNRIYSGRSSSDRWLTGGQRDNISFGSSSARPCSSELQRDHYHSERFLSGPSSSSAQEALEREWERQLADGEVDSNGVPILPDRMKQMPIECPNTSRTSHHSFPGSATTHLGRRNVDGLGLQLALVASRVHSGYTLDYFDIATST